MKQTKIEKLINALSRGGLTVREIASRFKIPNVYAVINDIRNVHNLRVVRGKTVTGKTYYYIDNLRISLTF